jgi:hypothetical protein
MSDSDSVVREDVTELQTAFIERQNHCPLCGSQLDIRVESYLENHLLREEAHCPSCEVMARVKDHKMQ